MNFFDWIARKTAFETHDIDLSDCGEFVHYSQEVKIRELCFWICVNMIANGLGRCEFRTFKNNTETHERDYYLWNVEPNMNQNSTAFLHKLVSKLYVNNECLIIDAGKFNDIRRIAVADSWNIGEQYPDRPNQYSGVTVDDYQYIEPFYEKDVLHLKLNHVNIRSVLYALNKSYSQMIAAAMKAYGWENGNHLKVHVGQIAQGKDGWNEDFMKMINTQVKPFFDSDNAVLPEFDGYEYTEIGSKNPRNSRDIRDMMEDIFDFTARAFMIPAVLVNGKIEGTAVANRRFLTNCIVPLCDQQQVEIIRKRYGYQEWVKGNYLKIDSSSFVHFDMFENAANVEKLVGSAAYSINDILKAAGQPEINEDWANAHYMTRNFSDLSELASPMNGG